MSHLPTEVLGVPSIRKPGEVNISASNISLNPYFARKRADFRADFPGLLLVPCGLSSHDESVLPFVADAMIDSGCQGNLLSSRLAELHGLPLTERAEPVRLTMADGTSTIENAITHDVILFVNIGSHTEHLKFGVTKNLSHDLMLGRAWLNLHDPTIQWSLSSVRFSSAHCRRHCFPSQVLKPASSSVVADRLTLLGPLPSDYILATVSVDPDVDPEDRQDCLVESSLEVAGALSGFMADYEPFSYLNSVSVSLDDAEVPVPSEPPVVLVGRATAEAVRSHLAKLLEPRLTRDQELEKLKNVIPAQYHDVLPVFSRFDADQLPPHRGALDCAIELKSDAVPKFGPLYPMNDLELQVLRTHLEEEERKGFIVRTTDATFCSPVLIATKGEDAIRFCVDYSELNSLIKKNVTPIPDFNTSARIVGQAKIYTRLDLRAAFNLIRIRPGDEPLTAFRTRYGVFMYRVMPFGLTSAPGFFQHFLNHVLRQFLDVCCVVYIDDILIFSDSLEEHVDHVRSILGCLASNGLFVKGEKCEFHVTTTRFLGFMFSTDGISMDPSKIDTVVNWPTPENVKDVMSFLGFANFYRRFIESFSELVLPLTNLTRKEVTFTWGDDQSFAFKSLKKAFTSHPVLRHFNCLLPTVLETDASDFAISAILSQWHPAASSADSPLLHPTGYYSRKLTPPELNYGVGDKELLAIVVGCEEYRPMLESLGEPFTVFTDHSNLTALATKKVLNRRQARWRNILSGLDFTILYRPGAQNARADALTRRSNDRPEVLLDTSLTILEARHFAKVSSLSAAELERSHSSALFSASAVEVSLPDTLLADIKLGYASDVLYSELVALLNSKEPSPRHKAIELSTCSVDDDGLLRVNGLVYVPDDEDLRRRLIESRHSHPVSGHPGVAGTYDLITRDFWFPGVRSLIMRYVKNCDVCSRIKPSRTPPFGLLRPLVTPEHRWSSVSFDMVTGLPDADGYNALMVFVDRLSKMAHFIPCRDSLSSSDFVDMFLNHIIRLHGVPVEVVSDRGAIFMSEVTLKLHERLGIAVAASTAFHPQTDGQTERINAIVEQYLRGYVSYEQDDWPRWLALAEFCHNNRTSSSTQLSPFYANYGYHPRFQVSPDKTRSSSDINLFINRLQELELSLRQEMSLAQAAYAEQADRHRLASPLYRPGDKVWLTRRFIKTTRPSTKLDHKRLGPFPIVKAVGSHAYKLKLPASMRIHTVFHVSLLSPVIDSPLQGQESLPPPPVVVEGENLYFVDEVLDSKKEGGRWSYLVKWTGYEDPSWEPRSNIQSTAAFKKFIKNQAKR